MTNRNELIEAFAAIMELAGKVDSNQQKANFVSFTNGQADTAYVLQEFVDNQRVRLAGMHKAFNLATADMTVEQVNEIRMVVVNRWING